MKYSADTSLRRSVRIFKMLANPIRLRIIMLLCEREMSVYQLLTLLKIRKSNLSQHLRLLRYLEILRSRRKGKQMLYHIKDERIIKICDVVQKI